MKKIKLMIVSALAAVALGFGFGFYPVLTSAEEAGNSVETSEIISSEEVVEETESVENTPNDEAVGGGVLTFDELLELYKDIAENAGFTDDWEKAVYYIEKAASAKKVDVMIWVNVAFVVLFVVDRIIKIVRWYIKKKDTTSDDVAYIKKSSGQQTTAINTLIDEVEGEKVAVNNCVEREKVLAHALEKQNVAIRSLIRGTKIDPNLKDEAYRALNDSDKLCVEAKG